MKSLWLGILSFCLSTSAFALAVGDRAESEGTFTRDGVTVPYTGSVEITAYDSSSKLYTVHYASVLPNGQPYQMEEKVTKDELVTDEEIAEVLNHCEEGGGKLENVTVKAGTFTTCHLDGVWLGDVPFAGVKTDIQTDKFGVTSELVSFTRGHK